MLTIPEIVVWSQRRDVPGTVVSNTTLLGIDKLIKKLPAGTDPSAGFWRDDVQSTGGFGIGIQYVGPKTSIHDMPPLRLIQYRSHLFNT